MSAAAFVERLFRLPGDCRAGTTHLLAQAAAMHGRLLSSAPAGRPNGREDPLPALVGYLKGQAAAADKRRLLDDPLLVEALHALASASPTLTQWDDAVAARPGGVDSTASLALGRAKLGNLALAVLLRERPAWQGEVELSTDGFGSLRFPFCDWSVWLLSQHGDVNDALAEQAVVVSLDAHEARWRLADEVNAPFLVLSRSDMRRMMLEDDPRLDARSIQFPHANVRPRLQFAAALGTSGIHYDPIAAPNGSCPPGGHSAITGAIVGAVLDSIHANAPAIYRQLCAYVRTIRGFELPAAGGGLLESYSTPLTPGVIGFNVSYTDEHEPLLSPFCFTWLGHELGHTMHYLIDDAAWLHGEAFVSNALDATPRIARYGRALPVRTLFQVPYVHLYEWALLMDFMVRRFSGLPWSVGDGAVTFGDELSAEIAEAFDLIGRHARLTTLGKAALAHLRRLAALTSARWQRVAA